MVIMPKHPEEYDIDPLGSESDQEAFRSQQQLQALVGKILSENKVLKGKLEQLDGPFASRNTIISRPNSEMRALDHNTADDTDDAATIRETRRNPVRNSIRSAYEFAFEHVLKQSWVTSAMPTTIVMAPS